MAQYINNMKNDVRTWCAKTRDRIAWWQARVQSAKGNEESVRNAVGFMIESVRGSIGVIESKKKAIEKTIDWVKSQKKTRYFEDFNDRGTTIHELIACKNWIEYHIRKLSRAVVIIVENNGYIEYLDTEAKAWFLETKNKYFMDDTNTTGMEL